MKKICVRAVSLIAAFAVFVTALPTFFTSVSAAGESRLTHLSVTNNPDYYADITIEGNHFTVDGRAVNDPVVKVRFSVNNVDIYNYQFTEGDDYSFHAEFDAEYSGDWCYFWMVKESRLAMNYRIHYDENGWYFPSNGLAELNAEKLENILTAAPEASSYYISQTADPDEIEQTLAELEGLVEEICGDEQDDYKKAFLIYRWVAGNVYYDKDAAKSEVTLDTIAIHNVLQRRRTTCAGYANTFCAMLEIAGIRSVNLKGAAVAGDVTYENLLTAGENHEFSAFWYEAENRWVYADATWGSNGKYENGEYSYDYPVTDKNFDVTGDAFALDHRIDKVEERNYTGVLNIVEETETTDSQPPESSEPESSETDETSEAAESSETESTQSSTSRTDRSPVTVTAPPSNQDYTTAIYIVIGAAGVVIVITGIILATRKKK